MIIGPPPKFHGTRDNPVLLPRIGERGVVLGGISI
jgi:hypothetical protein